VGGLGFACSANIGEDVAIFEPTHGSAPKYFEYETSIVNPIAMILSACMMLDHINETEKAIKIRQAIARLIEEGKVQAYDMLKLPGSPDVLSQGAASTAEMTDQIIHKL
jgi:3-isopropylmalate dehydrogenase